LRKYVLGIWLQKNKIFIYALRKILSDNLSNAISKSPSSKTYFVYVLQIPKNPLTTRASTLSGIVHLCA